MRVEFESSFARDLRRLKNRKLKQQVADIINRFETAEDLYDIAGIKKLRAARDAYRLRVGDHRLGFLLRSRVVIFVRFLDRRDIYRHFP